VPADPQPESTPDNSLEKLEIELLLSAVAQHHGYDFRDYAEASMARRIRKAVSDEGIASVSALQHHVLHDPDALGRLIQTLTVTVTSMFRDAEFYRAFRSRVIPHLRTFPFVRLWHAGCSTGEEVYSLAILLHEEGLYDRCRIYATDVSEHVLDRARRGIYRLDRLRKYTDAYHRAGGTSDFSRYYVADEGNAAIITAPLRRNIVFSQHSLTTDGSFNEFHAIVCRNVLIYFNDELQRRVTKLLHDSLSRFGYLAIGRKERIEHTAIGRQYEQLTGDLRIYKRVS
jgi:chemotaxis protein methyltransferase CheR